MRKLFYIIVIPLLLIVNSIKVYSQSNQGTEFWTAWMDHIDPSTGNSPSYMILYITADISTTGNVSLADGSFSQSFTVTANQVTFVSIPSSAFLGSSGAFNKGIHITSAKPIAVYAHIYADNVSGATLLLPVNAMGKDYLSLNYTQISNAPANNPAYSVFDIIATEDTTTVSITPAAALITGQPAGTAFTITLNKGQVYQGLSLTDLTGSQIQSVSNSSGSCKKIAVFSGSSKIGISVCTTNGGSLTSDNLFQQVYPTSTWGKNYITAPLKSRDYDIYRIILSTPGTNVTLDGTVLTASQFINNLYYQFTSQTTHVISADQPIQVVQYTPTEGQTLNCITDGRDVGDPEMIYLSPIEQGLNHVTLYSTGYYDIVNSYINVVMPTSAVSSFTLDGVPYTNFQPVTNNTTYSYAQIPVTSGPHAPGAPTNPPGGTITSGTHNIAASAPFNAIAYGFGNVESYGYAAGTNLQDLNEFVTFANPQTDTTVSSGCSGVPYTLQVTIPYQTTNITWKIDSVTTFTDPNPQVKSQILKGTTTLYTYNYPNPVSFAAGSHEVIATVFDPLADVCGSNEEIDNNFTITNPPVSGFAVAAKTCLGDSTAFKDTSTVTQGTSPKAWFWDFGDGATSTLHNPSHQYAASGNYIVHLTVTDNNGCSDVSNPDTIHIIPKPVASFTASTPDCSGQNITFTNTSTTAEGNIVSWAWNLGDGTTTVLTSGQPFTHIYANPGNDTVKLTVTTDEGCISNVFQQVVAVKPPPVVDFTLPDICISDGTAQFTDNTTINDNVQETFTYLWDFGDPASGNNNTSILKNPQHRYSQEGNYTVTLTVTSQYGCSASKSQQFTVNGATPKADFQAENFCSADSIIFDDLSTVDFGNVTKIVWHFDNNGNPNVTETYTTSTMSANKKYKHKYPTFNTPAQQTYDVRMEAYSGISCVSVLDKNIVISANPIINLTINNNPVVSPVTLCQSDAAIQIVENKNGYSGTGVFSGTGISSTGLFDPKVSGIGTFTINYVFTADVTGCTYTTSFQVAVNATPSISLPATYTVLEGGEVTLSPVVNISTGTVTYNWSPSAGLNQNNIAKPIASPSANTTYTLTVTSDKGCTAAAQVFVSVLKAPLVPNAFTPNGDGINDTWDIKYLNSYPNATVAVFNRYGTQVYFSYGYPVSWDGRYKGADLPAGTYYYLITPGSGRKPISGFVAIIR